MPDIILPNLGLELPDIGSDQDTWGDILNADLTILDTAVQYDVVSKILGAVDVTLTDVEAASAVINLTGTLTANVSVIVPASPVRLYLVRNGTSGAFTVTIKTAAGTGVSVLQGTSSLVYSDGTNIVQGATSVNGSFFVTGNTTLGDAAGDVVTVNAGTTTYVQGTSNGVAYLNGSKVLTTGSALTFDGTNLGVGTASPGARVDVRGGTSDIGLRYIETTTGNTNRIQLGAVSGAGYIDATAGAGSPILQLRVASDTKLTLDTAGNAGLGMTPSAWGGGERAIELSGSNQSTFAGLNSTVLATSAFFNGTTWISKNSAIFPSLFRQTATGQTIFNTASLTTAGAPISFTQAMTLTQGGNLLVGTTTASSIAGLVSTLSIGGTNPTTSGGVAYQVNGVTRGFHYVDSLDLFHESSNGGQRFIANGGEAARITSARYFKASNTGSYKFGGNNEHEINSDANGTVLYAVSTSTGSSVRCFSADLPAGATGNLYVGSTNNSVVYQVLANGNVQNSNNSYGPLVSDPRLKENVDYNVNYLDDLMRLEVCKFSFKSENLSEPNQLGFLTSNIKEVFPKLIEKAGKAEDYGLPEGEPDLETYKASVLLPITIRALQEANNKIDALIARIEALEAK